MPSRRTIARSAWLAALTSGTLILLWLWIAAQTDRPKRLFHSTDRFCSYIGFERGSFIYWYDGGADVRTFTPRDFSFLGIFCKASGDLSGWQYFSAGLHGGYACGWLAVLWVPTIWFVFIRPRLRRKRGWCLACGYDLKGVRDLVCPECGRARESAPRAPRPA